MEIAKKVTILIMLALVSFLLILNAIERENKIQELEEENKELHTSLENAIINTEEYKELYEGEIESKERVADDLKECSVQKEELDSVNKRLLDSDRLMKPTLSELKEFLRKDKTDTIEWSTDFDCTEFSSLLVSRLRDKGYYACTTELELAHKGGHIIVAINIQDYGVVYVEPQNDAIIYDLEANTDYCDYHNWDCNWYIERITHCWSF